MNEMIPVFGIIALTAVVLVGLLAVFRKYVLLRDHLMKAYEPAERQAPRGAAKRAEARRAPARTDVRIAA